MDMDFKPKISKADRISDLMKEVTEAAFNLAEARLHYAASRENLQGAEQRFQGVSSEMVQLLEQHRMGDAEDR